MASKRTRRMSATVVAGLVALALVLGVAAPAAHAEVSKAGGATENYFEMRLESGRVMSF